MSTERATAYINAGGRGTRLDGVLSADPRVGITKAMIPAGERNEPVLAYHIRRYLGLGFRNIVVGCGDHLQVAEYVDERFGRLAEVSPVMSLPQAGTGGDLQRAAQQHPELFAPTTVVANCDTLLDTDERRLIAQHEQLGADATIVLTTRPDAPNPGAFLVASDGMVLRNYEAVAAPTSVLELPDDAYAASSCGMVAMRTTALLETERRGEFSIYRELLGDLSLRGALGAYNNGDGFFMDIGVPSTYQFIQENPAVIDGLLEHVNIGAARVA